MKRITRIGLFAMIMMILLTIPAFAEASTRASNFFARTSTYIEKTSGTAFDVWFDVTAVSLMDELGTSTIKVQRSSDKSTWTTMKTFSKADYSQMIDETTFRHTDCVTYTGTSGYFYRAKVTFYAKNDTGTGEYVMYTSTVSVP